MKAGTVSIHLISPDNTCHRTDISCLTSNEKIRAARFHITQDAVRWVACRAALRRTLSRAIGLPPDRVPIMLTEFGKPVLGGEFSHLHFNLSHCNSLALIALSLDGPVGIDLEPLERAPDLLECTDTFCHPLETDTLPANPSARASRLLEIWTAKEALLKALGTGLSHPPETVRIHFANDTHTGTSDTPLKGTATQRIRRISHPDLSAHCAHVSCPVSCTAVEINGLRPAGASQRPQREIPVTS